MGLFTSFVTWSSMDTLTEGAWGVTSFVTWSSMDTLTEVVYGVFTSFVTWSSMDTLTEGGVWGVHILCNLVIHGYSDRGGSWGYILCNLVIHGYSDRGGMGCTSPVTSHPWIL